MEIEGIFTSAGFTPPVAAQASKPLSDAEIESGVPMHRKGSIAFRDGVRWAEQRHGIKERAMCENSMLSDADFAFDMLALMFDAYENGVTCYEDPEDEVGFIGYAYRLADDDFQNIATFLNRVRPVQPGSKERG